MPDTYLTKQQARAIRDACEVIRSTLSDAGFECLGLNAIAYLRDPEDPRAAAAEREVRAAFEGTDA